MDHTIITPAPARASIERPFWQEVAADVRTYVSYGNPTWGAFFSAIIFGRGIHLLFSYRIQRRLMRIPVIGRTLAKILYFINSLIFGCELSMNCPIAGGVYIPHPFGIVISKYAEIHTGVTIHQQVTLGLKHARETGIRQILLPYCNLGAGSKIIGHATVGEHASVRRQMQSSPKIFQPTLWPWVFPLT